MGGHEELVVQQWTRYLKRPDIVDGNFYFYDNGDCVGRIKKMWANGSFVKAEFEWSARKVNGNWRKRADNTVSKQMYRIRDHKPDAKEIWSGRNRIEFAGHTTVEKEMIIGKKFKADEPVQKPQGSLF